MGRQKLKKAPRRSAALPNPPNPNPPEREVAAPPTPGALAPAVSTRGALATFELVEETLADALVQRVTELEQSEATSRQLQHEVRDLRLRIRILQAIER